MDIGARMTSKGQITVPRPVRDALGLREGDRVVFRVEQGRAVMAKTVDFLELAGSVPVPVSKRRLPWREVLAEARRARGARVVGRGDPTARRAHRS